MAILKQVKLSGFKSIRAMDLELRSLNVVIGVNGAGKSNLISFFKMLNEMMGGRLQQYIAANGYAQSLLHFGPKVTPQFEAELEFDTDNGTDSYYMRLFYAAGDALVFAEERLKFVPKGWQGPREPLQLGPGHQETRIREEAEKGNAVAKAFRHLLNRCRVFHFHDTSQTARIRQYCYVGDDRLLMPDAGNLAAVLNRLRNKEEGPAYHRIVETVRRIAPFFEDFELEPSGRSKQDITLNWRHKASDRVFGPHQLSDGTLRAIALVTLLLQPVEDLPDVILVDEPELGLHPAAKSLIAGLIQKASHHCQIVIATQSTALLDTFEPDDVVVVERDERASRFQRLNPDSLKNWLSEYSLGELWEKNVIGGGPFA